jgi:hypothetical protein
MELADVMLSEVNQAQKDKRHIFSHMWNTDPKDKCIHTKEHLFIEHICNNGSILWN